MRLSLMNSPVDCVTASNTNMAGKKFASKATGAKAKSGKAKGNKRRAEPITRAALSQSRTTVQRPPNMAVSYSRNDAKVRITHREYLMDVLGSDAFACTKVPLNPGLAVTFPWLSSVANNYESYKFLKLSVEYETMCSTTTVGSLMMAIDFDAADETPNSKQTMLGYHNAVRTAAWNRAAFTADSADLNKNGQKMTRNRPPVANLDIKTYDVGNLFVATQGFGGPTTIGEVYLVYEIELHTPQLVTEPTFLDSARIVSGGAVAANTPFGTTPAKSVAPEDPLPIEVTGSTFIFGKSGQYLLDMYTGGTGITGPPTITGSVAPTLVANIVNAAGTISNDQWLVDVVAGTALIFSFVGHLTTIVNTVTRISPYYKTLA